MFGKRFNTKNPKDLNEKILWLSLFSDTTEWTRLTDKYAVRGYVAERGLENILVPLYGKWEKADDIKWEALPNSFVLKTNNGSGTVIIVKDKNSVNEREVKLSIGNMLAFDNSSSTTEFHYKNIHPCIIAEQLIDYSEDINQSSSIIDYKIWCLNGVAYYIWVCKNREIDKGAEVALFDVNWNYLPEKSVFTDHYREQSVLVKKPDNLKEMLRVAEKLAEPFPEVRVDLYNINGKIYFGEMTFTSLGGTMNYLTQDCLLEMGSKLDISKVKKIR